MPHGAAPYTGGPYGAAPYGGAPFGAAAPQAGHAARPAKNALGTIALVIGVVVLLSSTASLIAQAVVISSADYVAIGIVANIFAVVQGLLALAAIVCGAIGLAQKGRAKGAAGIGLGIGVTALWAVLGSLVYGSLISLMTG
jgi:hypothetical protein